MTNKLKYIEPFFEILNQLLTKYEYDMVYNFDFSFEEEDQRTNGDEIDYAELLSEYEREKGDQEFVETLAEGKPLKLVYIEALSELVQSIDKEILLHLLENIFSEHEETLKKLFPFDFNKIDYLSFDWLMGSLMEENTKENEQYSPKKILKTKEEKEYHKKLTWVLEEGFKKANSGKYSDGLNDLTTKKISSILYHYQTGFSDEFIRDVIISVNYPLSIKQKLAMIWKRVINYDYNSGYSLTIKIQKIRETLKGQKKLFLPAQMALYKKKNPLKAVNLFLESPYFIDTPPDSIIFDLNVQLEQAVLNCYQSESFLDALEEKIKKHSQYARGIRIINRFIKRAHLRLPKEIRFSVSDSEIDVNKFGLNHLELNHEYEMNIIAR